MIVKEFQTCFVLANMVKCFKQLNLAEFKLSHYNSIYDLGCSISHRNHICITFDKDHLPDDIDVVYQKLLHSKTPLQFNKYRIRCIRLLNKKLTKLEKIAAEEFRDRYYNIDVQSLTSSGWYREKEGDEFLM